VARPPLLDTVLSPSVIELDDIGDARVFGHAKGCAPNTV
jgi:hypothetical protein